MALFKSTPERFDRVSNLRPEQETLYQQQQAALQGSGAGGAFGDAADYYRGLTTGAGDKEFTNPLMRQFREDIIPGIAEQFAGLGSGGLSSGGFISETGRAGTDLSERLGAARAQLRQMGAQGLAGLAKDGLSPVDEIAFRPRQPSLFEKVGESLIPGVAGAAATAVGGPLAGAASSLFTKFLTK